MRTPKESFLLSGKADEFKKILATESFEVACDYALLQLVSDLPPNTTPSLPTDPYIGIDANAQLFGAKRVLAILQSLAEPVPTKKTDKRDTLNYDRP